jgi:hypothetical protein
MKPNGYARQFSPHNMDDAAPKIPEAWLACAHCSFCGLDLRLCVIF